MYVHIYKAWSDFFYKSKANQMKNKIMYYSDWKNLHEFLWHAYQSIFDMYVIS